MPGTRLPWREHGPAALGLLALVLLAYANSLRTELILDSAHLVLGDPRVHQATLANLRRIFAEDSWSAEFVTGAYRPLTTLSFLLNYAVIGNGADPLGYHVVNLLLHGLNALLVWALARRLLPTAWLAWFTAAIFAVHPIATEAVTNVVGRSDLLATLAVLLGLHCHLASDRHTGWRHGVLVGGVALALALGLLAKETAAALAGLVLLADLARWEAWSRPALGRRLARHALVLVPPFLLLFLLRWRVYAGLTVREIPFLENPIVGADFWSGRLTAIKVLGRYAALLVWPRHLAADYSFEAIPLVRWPPAGWEDWQALMALAGLAAVIVLALRIRRRDPAAFFFLGFFPVAILPVSNLLLPIGTIMGERLAYLPSVGFAGCLVLAVSRLVGARLGRSSLVASVVLSAMVVGYVGRTVARNRDWRNLRTLFESAVRVVPGSFKVHMGLAQMLSDTAGEAPERLARLTEEAERAVAIIGRAGLSTRHEPLNPHLILAAAYARQAAAAGPGTLEASRWHGRVVQALERAAVVGRGKLAGMRRERWPPADPESVNAYRRVVTVMFQLGDAQERGGDAARAAATYDELCRLAPDQPGAYVRLARTQLAAGDPEGAAVSALAILALDGTQAEGWRLLSEAWARHEPGGCGLDHATGRPRLDLACPRVREHACRAYTRLAAALRDIGGHERAARLTDLASTQYGCAPAPPP